MEKSKDYESLVVTLRMLKESRVFGAGDSAVFEFFKYACLSGELNICSACIDAGFDVNMCDNLYGEPLLIELASDKRFTVDVAEFLIKNGAKTDIIEKGCFKSPLTTACCCGNLEMVKYLIDKGVAVIRKGINLMDTDLGAAITNDQVEVARLLLNLGVASVNDMEYLTSELMERSKYKMVEVLLQFGASPNKGNLLSKAVEKGSYKMAELLLKYGADPNKYQTLSPLHSAVIKGNVELARLLLDNKADVNAKVEKKSIIKKYEGAILAFDIAICKSDTEMQRLLQEYGGHCSSRLERLEVLSDIALSSK